MLFVAVMVDYDATGVLGVFESEQLARNAIAARFAYDAFFDFAYIYLRKLNTPCDPSEDYNSLIKVLRDK